MTRMKYNTELKMVISVEFVAPDKAQDVFIDGDWSEVFWSRADLQEIAQDISCMFSKKYLNEYPPYFLEGFGEAVRHTSSGDTYIIDVEVVGGILITCESDLDVDYSEEVL